MPYSAHHVPQPGIRDPNVPGSSALVPASKGPLVGSPHHRLLSCRLARRTTSLIPQESPDCEASIQGNQSGTQRQREPTAELVCMIPGLPPRNLPRTRDPDTQSRVLPFYFRSTYSILRAPVHSFQSGEQATFPGARAIPSRRCSKGGWALTVVEHGRGRHGWRSRGDSM